MQESDICSLSRRMRAGTNRASEDIIEAQNREYAERIASKTSFLKTVALDMESEAKDHHRSVIIYFGDRLIQFDFSKILPHT